MRNPRVLVFTKTVGYRHDSIPDAITALRKAGPPTGILFHFTEDASDFNDENLAHYDCLIFISTIGEVLDDKQREAMYAYLRNGGNYIGVHAGSACLYGDKQYEKLVGAHFDYHPSLQQATFRVLDKTHPSTSHLPDTWTFEEEVYRFRSDPRKNGVSVLMTVEEGSYHDDGNSTGDYPSNGTPHPIAWYNENPESSQPRSAGALLSGRSFYTSLGHCSSTWKDEQFMNHILGGLRWTLDAQSTRCFGRGNVGNAG